MRGFSLVELLVSLLIVLVVTNALVALVNPAQVLFTVQAEMPDMEQRLRVSAEMLGRDVRMAGGGTFASVVPQRRGLESPDAPGTYRSDRVSALHVPATAPHATVARATDGAGTIEVAARPRCPPTDPVCGFRSGALAVIFDATGAYDTFLVSGVSTDPPAVLHAGFSFAKSYPAGATVAHAEAATYWLRVDPRSNVSQLMKYDGQQTDLPLADNVAELRFEYYADAASRLDSAVLTDGPWLPDATFANRFDADLRRVRRVRATIRVRANQTILHSPIADRAATIEIAVRTQSLFR
jgi:prepilin-type N-terminal cleavage/methylation domain-containing protein